MNLLVPDIIFSVFTPQTEKVFIAYSGGIDSHVLLHLAASIPKFKSKITAVYVHHGLQQEADAWAQHCSSTSLALDVQFQCLQINAQIELGQSPEEVARDARYKALKKLIGGDDVLLVGQHREDQMETVLLQLFRGAGVQGLCGMPLSTKFGLGVLCRPFLDVPKQSIKDYAIQNNLKWIEDPSNGCDNFDRNFLRNNIIPQLKQRWPSLDKTVARSSRHCANSHKIAQDLAKELLSQLYNKVDNTLCISGLLKLDQNKQQLVIRQWFHRFQLRMPSEKILKIILNEVVLAQASAKPEVKGKGYRIRRYRDKLYCLTSYNDIASLDNKLWPQGQMQLLLEDGQQLILIDAGKGISKTLWQQEKISIRYRKGREKIKLPGREGHHSLKKLYQEVGIPPWERNNIPLIYSNDNLVAVADLWVSINFIDTKKGACYQISRKNNDNNDRIIGF